MAHGAASSLSNPGPHAASAGRLSPIRESRKDDGTAAVKRVAIANSAPGTTPGDPTIPELGLFELKQAKKEVRKGKREEIVIPHQIIHILFYQLLIKN